MKSTANTGFGAMASVDQSSSQAQSGWGAGKIVASGLLGLNALMQIGGGSMMSFAPGKAAIDMFGITPNADVNRLIAIIGGATLGCFALSVATLVSVVRNRRAGSALALAQGSMLTIIGVVMVATGTSMGVVDIGKGVMLTLIGLWAARAIATQTEAA